MEFLSSVVRETDSIPRSAKFEAVSRPVQGLCTINVRNETLDDMACVVIREIPLQWRWNLCEFLEKVHWFQE